jgi:hypothetical protein
VISQPFDPRRLTREASLQRVVIAGLSGVPADIAGRPAWEICSRDALTELVVEAAGLPAPEPQRLSDQLGELRWSRDPEVGERARRVLHAYGVRLGALLATLKHPGTPTEQGSTPGRLAYLEHWLGIPRVWLGGGLLAGAGAADIVEGAEQLLARTGTVLDLQVAPSPTLLPLAGAALSAEPVDGRAVVADAGHSRIKAGVAVIDRGGLTALETLDSWPTRPDGGREAVEAVLVSALAAAASALGGGQECHRRIVVSIASYLDGGAAVDDGRSIYGGITPGRVSELVGARTGSDFSVDFVHDGSASALGIADPGVSAVITVGTWLGIGFTPAQRGEPRGWSE